jgi:hypothetical protein
MLWFLDVGMQTAKYESYFFERRTHSCLGVQLEANFLCTCHVFHFFPFTCVSCDNWSYLSFCSKNRDFFFHIQFVQARIEWQPSHVQGSQTADRFKLKGRKSCSMNGLYLVKIRTSSQREDRIFQLPDMWGKNRTSVFKKRTKKVNFWTCGSLFPDSILAIHSIDKAC